MTYDISRAGTGLKIVLSDGTRYDMPDPTLDWNPVVRYPATVPVLEIRSALFIVQLTAADTVTVAGSPGAGTLSGVFNQLIAIL